MMVTHDLPAKKISPKNTINNNAMSKTQSKWIKEQPGKLSPTSHSTPRRNSIENAEVMMNFTF